jgi:type II secretory pathway pseudopilin PulG
MVSDWADERLAKEQQQLAAFKQPIIDIATTSAKIISFSPDETKILYEATASATIPQIIKPSLIGTNPTTEERTIKPGIIYIYDSKEDKNYLVLDKTELPTIKVTPTAKTTKSTTPARAPNGRTQNIHWFPTSKHLLLTLEGKIDIMEYDRTNWVTIYSGPFENSFVAPWSNGSRIIIMTNLNPGVSTLPNLYTVNLR